MGKKMVLASGYIGIYFSGEDLDRLLDWCSSPVPALIDKNEISNNGGFIIIDEDVAYQYKLAIRQAQVKVQEVQDEFYRTHPNYEASETGQQRRRRHARKLQSGPDGVD